MEAVWAMEVILVMAWVMVVTHSIMVMVAIHSIMVMVAIHSIMDMAAAVREGSC